MSNIKSLILNFIYKFFFILRAAADGTIVSYIGGNKFEFKTKSECINSSSNSINHFISKYSKNTPMFILKK